MALNNIMDKRKISFQYSEGTIDGIYIDAGKETPIVIVVNGHNGFYTYGMFPYIQEQLSKHGISSYSFNYSHGGIIGDADYFEDLEKYEQNCMRLETADLLEVLNNLKTDKFNGHGKTLLLAHSLGGVPAIFGAKKALEEKIDIDGIILVSTVKTLRFWPTEMINEWVKNGVYFKKNNRTKQELPQGFEFLQEVINADAEWNVKEALQSLHVPVLIVHGENDEAIPLEHGESQYAWSKEKNPDTTFMVIPGATHTYNTKHPFENATIQVNELITTVIDWIKKL